MRPIALTLAAGAALTALAGFGTATEERCGSFGTRVKFVSSPSEAARIARQEQKLVFVLHVSGNFEDSRFT